MRRAFLRGASLQANDAVAGELKDEFPIFRTHAGTEPLVYLDSAATSQKPLAVLDAMEGVYREACANVHRAIHTLGEEATRRYESARTRTATRLGAASRREVVFTRGTTESINLLARTLGEGFSSGDEIVLSEMEHHANLVPWQQLAARRGLKLRFVPVLDSGELDLAAYERLLGKKTRLVGVTATSNVLGTVNPVRSIADLAHAAGALVLVDAAQYIPRSGAKVTELGADFLAFSAHKHYGPFGIGVLWGREALLEAMPPFMGGGDMISDVTLEGFTANELPWKFEAGTPAIAEAAGLEAALDWLDSVDPDALGGYESELAARLIAAFDEIPGVRVLGRAPGRAGIVAFTVEGVHAHDLAAWLDRSGVAVRAGQHCAHPLSRRFGDGALAVSSARASFAAYSRIADADLLASLVRRAREEA